MFRPVSQRFVCLFRQSLGLNNANQLAASGVRNMSSHGRQETDQEFDDRYETYFNRPDIDSWEIRKGINDLHGMDLVSEPRIIIAVLKACRRLNDYALAVRYLESLKDKCGNKVKEIYPYLLQEIKPTLDELGIDTPEQLGYDKPELHLQSVYDIN